MPYIMIPIALLMRLGPCATCCAMHHTCQAFFTIASLTQQCQQRSHIFVLGVASFSRLTILPLVIALLSSQRAGILRKPLNHCSCAICSARLTRPMFCHPYICLCDANTVQILILAASIFMAQLPRACIGEHIRGKQGYPLCICMQAEGNLLGYF